jgi:hypothetical protein
VILKIKCYKKQCLPLLIGPCNRILNENLDYRDSEEDVLHLIGHHVDLV